MSDDSLLNTEDLIDSLLSENEEPVSIETGKLKDKDIESKQVADNVDVTNVTLEEATALLNPVATQQIQRVIEDPLQNDLLYDAVSKEEPTITVLNQILKEIAEEAAYLKTYRKDKFILENTSDVSTKRIKALSSMVETLIEREKIRSTGEGKIDFYGEGFEKVMKFILKTVSDVFEKSSIPVQYHDIFFAQLSQDLEGYEKKVEKIYYDRKS